MKSRMWMNNNLTSRGMDEEDIVKLEKMVAKGQAFDLIMKRVGNLNEYEKLSLILNKEDRKISRQSKNYQNYKINFLAKFKQLLINKYL